MTAHFSGSHLELGNCVARNVYPLAAAAATAAATMASVNALQPGVLGLGTSTPSMLFLTPMPSFD